MPSPRRLITYGTFPAYVPFAPTVIAPATATPGPNTLIVSGNLTLSLLGNQTYIKIVGDGDAIPDSLDLTVTGDVILDGFVGGLGLHNIKITTLQTAAREGGKIILLDDTTVSSRQVAAGANHWDAPSAGDSGNITLAGSVIEIGAGANILAHATGGFSAGDVTLTAHDTYEQILEFPGCLDYRWIETEATIDIAMDARLTGHDVTVQTTAETIKNAALDDEAVGKEFSTPTRAIVLGDLDTNPVTTRQDLIVGTLNRGILKYTNANDAFPSLPTVIDSDLTLNTVSLALGDIDDDSDLDLVAGNFGQANRLYLNDGFGTFALGVSFGAVMDTTEVALANLDADAELELVVGTHSKASSYTSSPAGTFGAVTPIERHGACHDIAGPGRR